MLRLSLFLLAAVAPDHSAWDVLLKKHVSEQSRVDYSRWQQEDVPALDGYLSLLAAPWPKPMPPGEEKAALINAYNALTIRWILAHYPTPSIWKTKKPFSEARHTLNGAKVSLDMIESKLRQMGDPRIHAALVCAARSCPPLRREAYRGDRIDAQLEANTRQWLANAELNRFPPDNRTPEVSMIFKWYARDFEENGGTLEGFLARYAPAGRGVILDGVKIRYRKYHWGLNDSGKLGEDYGGPGFYLDYLRNR
jgi:hypothetical protein